jgi:nucleoside 2-deoxyribosyltransferase
MIYLNIENSRIGFTTAWFYSEHQSKKLSHNTKPQLIDDAKNLYVNHAIKSDELLKYVSKKLSDTNKGAFEKCNIEKKDIYSNKISSPDEYLKIINYLSECKKITIEEISEQSHLNKEEKDSKLNQISLTPQGYQYLQDVLKHNTSNKVFIAMKFFNNKETTDAYVSSIQKACEQADKNLKANIVSQDHNDNINFRIIAEIKEAKFVIADFTPDLDPDNNPEAWKKYKTDGSYFEAGFAYGLGKQVIYTVHKDARNFLHFDINQINFIFWENHTDLTNQVLDRIKATIKL